MGTKEQNDIPKVIHYCWFGRKQLPIQAVKCIESWKKYCPGYEIIEWNESNFNLEVCTYVKEAYAEKKWAFVSDYARFWILYHEGGIYFDTDVELIKPIDDLVERGSFMGCEPLLQKGAGSMRTAINPGLGIGAVPGLNLYKEILDFYSKKSFYRQDGEMDFTTVVAYTTSILKRNGWRDLSHIQRIAGISVYPTEFFCPMNYYTGEIRITENTRSIHHYTASWQGKKENEDITVLRKLNGILGERIGYKIWRCYTFPTRVLRKLKRMGVKETIAFVVKKAGNKNG